MNTTNPITSSEALPSEELSFDDIKSLPDFIKFCKEREDRPSEHQIRWWIRFRHKNGLIETGAVIEKFPNPESKRPVLSIVIPRINKWRAQSDKRG